MFSYFLKVIIFCSPCIFWWLFWERIKFTVINSGVKIVSINYFMKYFITWVSSLCSCAFNLNHSIANTLGINERKSKSFTSRRTSMISRETPWDGCLCIKALFAFNHRPIPCLLLSVADQSCLICFKLWPYHLVSFNSNHSYLASFQLLTITPSLHSITTNCAWLHIHLWPIWPWSFGKGVDSNQVNTYIL